MKKPIIWTIFVQLRESVKLISFGNASNNEELGNKMQTKLSFADDFALLDSAEWSQSESDKGQIYTRPEVVEFMITAIGLNSVEDFEKARILEPSCGEGEFVVALVRRLLSSFKRRPSIKKLKGKLLAVDFVSSSIEIARTKVNALLIDRGYKEEEIEVLLDGWFQCCDFLLTDIQGKFTHVIGNPPYVRVESVPKPLLFEYRQRFSTMTDRADLYVAFYEKALSHLEENGKLSFICTDRWTKNTYGRSLRKLISDRYGLELFIDLYGIDAFEKDVMTYPAITQISKRGCEETILKHQTTFSLDEANEICQALNGQKTSLQKRKGIVEAGKPWLLGSADELALIHKIEAKYPLLENAGCKVFIGAATGANKIYIIDEKQKQDFEPCRTLPTVTAYELKKGKIDWQGKYLINTYDKNGVIQLEEFPKLKSYLFKHKEALQTRHVAKNDNNRWFKTIDRVYEERAKSEKLLIPDISSDPVVIYDKGDFHPNNSIYYVCSTEWNLHALRVILLSNITKLFITTYSTKIAKGYLRFQSQHLRKICLPLWDDLSSSLKTELINAGKNDQFDIFTKLSAEAYKLTKKDKNIIGI